MFRFCAFKLADWCFPAASGLEALVYLVINVGIVGVLGVVVLWSWSPSRFIVWQHDKGDKTSQFPSDAARLKQRCLVRLASVEL